MFFEEILKTPILLTDFFTKFFTNFFYQFKILLFNVFTHEQLKVRLLFLRITLIDTVTTAKSMLKSQNLNILHTNFKIEK